MQSVITKSGMQHPVKYLWNGYHVLIRAVLAAASLGFEQKLNFAIDIFNC